ncbi:mitotic checkpoint serine/threonine-protein kinase BUB1 beta-like isoform X1 [Rhodnius prolixus]|uniref:mitotic checkpoint serine/threonine-protein kinase BUB1 beta-like isoform X1 n=1 Tax=Rhodnius prolixus TaxID=13249 RepID=UPI003D18DA75
MDADAIDLCKENIQPLRQGRKAAQLCLALKAQDDKDVQEEMLKERDAFELSIITYEGDDPLEPRYNYVKWIEQCCPKFGPESHMIPLLEDTIMLFKDDDRYKQDPRFVELIIKYIETQDHAPELYQIVHSQGIGTKCAALYKSWAEYLDACQNIKGADQIYRLAVACNAEPIEVIKDLQAQFQLSVARRMLMGGGASAVAPVESRVTERQRKVLGKLKKTNVTGSLRNACGGPGPVNTLFSDSGHNAKINVYQEDEIDEGVLRGSDNNKLGSFANSEEVYKENTMKPQPWNHGFTKKQHRTPAPPPVQWVPSTPTFQVLRDDEDEDNDKNDANKGKVEHSQPTPVTSKVLKTRKAEIAQKTPIQLFKSPHVGSMKKNMPIFEVYSGGTNFSFEELRLAYYERHRKDGKIRKTPLTTEVNENIKPSSSSSTSVETPLAARTTNNISRQLTIVKEEENEEGCEQQVDEFVIKKKPTFKVFCD